MTQDRFWILLTKKLFEEATESELAELRGINAFVSRTG
jgi:hypothetical protein